MQVKVGEAVFNEYVQEGRKQGGEAGKRSKQSKAQESLAGSGCQDGKPADGLRGGSVRQGVIGTG